MKRGGPLKRTEMQRTPMKQRAKKPSLADFSVDTRLTMLERSRGLDEVTGEPLLETAQAHHRASRNMGGSRLDAAKGLASNGLMVNPGTHGYIEKHLNESYENGWKVHQGRDPATVPVLLHDGWHWLRIDGTMTADPRET